MSEQATLFDAPANNAPGPGGSGPQSAFAYGEAVDCVVLAGTHQDPRRLIEGRNKAFLEIAGRPLVRHVVEALASARQAGRIFVVGPVAELEAALAGCAGVHYVPQQGFMLDNGWAAIRAAEAEDAGLDEAARNLRPRLIISCDLPLILSAAVDDFILRAAARDAASEAPHAMLAGVVEEHSLLPYYRGNEGQPGMERPLVQVAEGRMRLANIYLVRPRLLAHSEFLQTSFSYRKAKDWRNVLGLATSLFSQPGGWGAAWMVLRLQLAAMLAKGGGAWYRRLRAGNTLARVDRGVSTVLGGRVAVLETPYGSLSLDVDDAEDYGILRARYAEWMALAEGLRVSLDPVTETPVTTPARR